MKDAKAALRTRLEATNAAENKAETGSPNDMDPSTFVLVRRLRDLGEPLAAMRTVEGNIGKRPRGTLSEWH